MGPLAWLSQLPLLLQSPLTAASAHAGRLTVAAGLVAGSLFVPGPVTRTAELTESHAGAAALTGPTHLQSPREATPGAPNDSGGGGTKSGTGASGTGPTTTSAAALPVSSTTATVVTTTTTTTALSRPPVLVADHPPASLLGSTITIDVLANDSDPDGDLNPATLSVASYPPSSSYQSITIVNGRVRYVARPFFIGTASFKYQVCDLAAHCGQATVTVTFILSL
jgi:hypothetical protein